MENTARSERTRSLALEAALAIIARDGPGRLTLDAIARESGISKGGLMHQFRSKAAVLKALLERQIDHFSGFRRRYLAEHGLERQQPELAARIATSREALTGPNAVAFAILGALAEEPELLSPVRAVDAEALEAIRAEALDPDLAIIRWLAARGLVTTSMMGICPLSDAERQRLFDRLLDDRQWAALPQAAPQPDGSA